MQSKGRVKKMALIKAQRGTKDVLGEESYKWQYVEKVAARVAKTFGYKEVRFPTFEDTALFTRGVGETTDIVQKEMYTFSDKGGRSVTLRPEGTASVVRVLSEHGAWGGLLPVKAYYIISAFRYEKPQAGRLREFHQFGVECFGSTSPVADLQTIKLAHSLLKELSVDGTLNINSIGCPKCRASYQTALKEYFAAHKETLCQTCNDRLERNPMRILDCKSPVCKEIAAGAPLITDFLCDECRTHYEKLQEGLTEAGIPFVKDPHIVRGLDYYTKTVFEFLDKNGLALLAGGRYDGLVKEIDGKAEVCGLGFASGIERLIGAMEEAGHTFGGEEVPKLFIASLGEKGSSAAERLADRLREKGIWAETDILGRSLKAQMKYADKIGAEYTVVLGDDEVAAQKAVLKGMRSEFSEEMTFDGIVEKLAD